MSYLNKFDERERKTIQGCIQYANDPYGDVAHNLKVIIAKLVKYIGEEKSRHRPFEIAPDMSAVNPSLILTIHYARNGGTSFVEWIRENHSNFTPLSNSLDNHTDVLLYVFENEASRFAFIDELFGWIENAHAV